MDFKLDENHDLDLSTNVVQLVERNSYIKQRLKQSFLFFLGEWFLDITDGVPYYEDILVKAPDRRKVEAHLKTAIFKIPEITNLTKFVLDFDPITRQLQTELIVESIYGSIEVRV